MSSERPADGSTTCFIPADRTIGVIVPDGRNERLSDVVISRTVFQSNMETGLPVNGLPYLVSTPRSVISRRPVASSGPSGDAIWYPGAAITRQCIASEL